MTALEWLAIGLYYEMSMSPLEWGDLDESEKENYRTWVEALLVRWDLVMEAHNEMQPTF
jgi:hypothetical protein